MITLIIPCYNEATRFDITYWQLIIDSFPDCRWIFVNDGSRDATASTLSVLQGDGVYVLELSKNLGKGEAIRAGMLSALSPNQIYQPDQIGYLDADGAFKISDISNMLDMAGSYLGSTNSYLSLISSRVKLSGRSIKRSAARHYLGRVIATFVCAGWNSAPYDTQSGFKIFRVNSQFREIVAKKFQTRWFFDIELLIQLERYSELHIWEHPLLEWHEIGNSTINLRQYFPIVKEILKIRSIVMRHNDYMGARN